LVEFYLVWVEPAPSDHGIARGRLAMPLRALFSAAVAP
jgi:hypothetical protein